MNVRAIVAAYLETNGYDGLCSEDCGCGEYDNDLFTYEGCPCQDCEPAYHHAKPRQVPDEEAGYGTRTLEPGYYPDKPEEMP